MLPTDLTVAAVIEKNGRFLMVEERASGVTVFSQPGGHIKAGESPEQACAREALGKACCEIAVNSLLGVYLWIHPQTRQQFLRVMYVADLLRENASDRRDDGVHALHWMDLAAIARRRKALRTPVALRCLDDYTSGKRQPVSVLAGAMPLQHRVSEVLASAALV